MGELKCAEMIVARKNPPVLFLKVANAAESNTSEALQCMCDRAHTNTHAVSVSELQNTEGKFTLLTVIYSFSARNNRISVHRVNKVEIGSFQR